MNLDRFKIVEKELDKVNTNALPYTVEQKEFIEYNEGDSILLSSVAGSGKTASCVGRLQHLINKKKVNPKKMIFFSFTNDAVNELKSRVQNDEIEITTIHSFCCKILGKLRKFRKIASFYDFIIWYQKTKLNKKPKGERQRIVEHLFEESETYSSEISTFKLMKADNIKSKFPK